MPCSSMFCSSFCSMLMLGLHAYVLTCLISCLWLCLAQIYMFVCTFYTPMPISESSHVCMLRFMFFHIYVLGLYMLMCMFLCLLVLTYVFSCLCVQIYTLYKFYTIFHVLVCSMPCLCSQTQALFVLPMLLQPFCSFCRIFLYFGLMVRTLSKPYGLCHCPYTLAHIKGFGSPILHVYACLLASMLYACVSLSYSRLQIGRAHV